MDYTVDGIGEVSGRKKHRECHRPGISTDVVDSGTARKPERVKEAQVEDSAIRQHRRRSPDNPEHMVLTVHGDGSQAAPGHRSRYD
ncbi:hypothetical protein [Corynebacterium neomassiliense]|uniref:hypothetical protein n=1 Tax=Corynebacterium neomassiliense TaxID=2079482 RepID=UPI001F3D7550|nr:hypothetical protein [Corynebacterium neomassiliense]